MRNSRGFTLAEILIAIAIMGIIAAIIIPKLVTGRDAAKLDACLAGIEAFATDVELLKLTGAAPTQDEVRAGTRWETTFGDYWYIPNNSDANRGHGNDLDGCDEENPGASLAGRECVPMRFLIICEHTNHAGAKYVFRVDGLPPQVVPSGDERPPFTGGAQWWEGQDQHFQKWIGR